MRFHEPLPDWCRLSDLELLVPLLWTFLSEYTLLQINMHQIPDNLINLKASVAHDLRGA